MHIRPAGLRWLSPDDAERVPEELLAAYDWPDYAESVSGRGQAVSYAGGILFLTADRTACVSLNAPGGDLVAHTEMALTLRQLKAEGRSAAEVFDAITAGRTPEDITLDSAHP